MSTEHKVGLQKIIDLCEKTSQASKRTLAIYDIALMAMGHTANQREFLLRQLEQSAIQKVREKLAQQKERRNAKLNVHRTDPGPEE